MKKTVVALFAFIITCGEAFAQSPAIHTGVYAGAGIASFSELKDMGATGTFSFGISAIGSRPLNEFFAIETYPGYLMMGSVAQGTIVTGDEISGKNFYHFRDQYRLHTVQLPVVAKFSMGVGDFGLNWFTGPELGFPVSGTASRQFADAIYEAENGYSAKRMNDLEPVNFSFIIGAGISYPVKRGTIGLNWQFHQPVTATGSINNEKFFANASMWGLTWMY
jgi:hypothetical protein